MKIRYICAAVAATIAIALLYLGIMLSIAKKNTREETSITATDTVISRPAKPTETIKQPFMNTQTISAAQTPQTENNSTVKKINENTAEINQIPEKTTKQNNFNMSETIDKNLAANKAKTLITSEHTPTLGELAVQEIPIATRSSDNPNAAEEVLSHSGIPQSASFSFYHYLDQLKNCTPDTLIAGADSVQIYGYKGKYCHVTYLFAGRKVDCHFSKMQIKQMTSPQRMEAAKNFDSGIGDLISPLGSDDPRSPLAKCAQ